MNVKLLSDLDLKGKRVFIRADLNVPQDDNGAITDDTRIRASLKGIQLALAGGAAVMVTSHLGRPTEGEIKPEDSLAPVAKRLSELLGRPVPLKINWVDGVTIAPGEVVLLENCRGNKGEKKNDETLSRKMAALCDIYVNDAFGTAHRAEATTHGIAKFAPIACAGPLLAAELDALGKALAAPKRPLAAIVAGSKVSIYLSGHYHRSSVVSTRERYADGTYAAIAVQAGTVSLRGRGEAPSFNLISVEARRISITTFAYGKKSFAVVGVRTFAKKKDEWTANTV